MTTRTKRLLWLLSQKPKLRTFSGVPPLTFKAKKSGTLKNYRIYGNTVNGESVGDRTGNLFDGTFIHRSVIGAVVGDDEPNRRSIVVDVSSYANGDKITFSRETSAGNSFQMYQVTSPLKGGSLLDGNIFSGNSETLLATITLDNISNYPYLMIFLNGSLNPIVDETLLASKIMVNVGYAPLPYEPYGYRVPVTVTNGTDTETTNIYLPEQIKMVGNEAEYVDYKEQKQHRVRKNLLQNTATSQTINGVTFTVNNDGSITCNGTATASTPSVLYIPFTLPIKLYELSGCPDLGSNSTYRVDIRNIDYSMYKYNGNTVVDEGTGCLFDGGNNQYCIRIAPGYTCNNLTFYPMIRKADIEDDTYEPYIADTELDVTLPTLPTLSGTNTLTVGTAVQPSNIEITGKIKGVTA